MAMVRDVGCERRGAARYARVLGDELTEGGKCLKRATLEDHRGEQRVSATRS